MRDTRADELLDEVIALAKLVKTNRKPARDQLAEWSNTISTAGGPGQKGGHSDPTATNGTRGRDPHAAAITAIDQAIENAYKQIKTAHDKTLLGIVKAESDHALPPCISCQREQDHRGIPIYNPAHARNLCWWCNEWWLEHDRQWPPVQILRAHHRGETITTRMVNRYQRTG